MQPPYIPHYPRYEKIKLGPGAAMPASLFILAIGDLGSGDDPVDPLADPIWASPAHAHNRSTGWTGNPASSAPIKPKISQDLGIYWSILKYIEVIMISERQLPYFQKPDECSVCLTEFSLLSSIGKCSVNSQNQVICLWAKIARPISKKMSWTGGLGWWLPSLGGVFQCSSVSWKAGAGNHSTHERSEVLKRKRTNLLLPFSPDHDRFTGFQDSIVIKQTRRGSCTCGSH